MKIEQYKLKSNGYFSLVNEQPFPKKQHPNQQDGLDLYVNVVDHNTGQINSVKLYENTRGLYFKKSGNWYLKDFTSTVTYVPFQIIEG